MEASSRKYRILVMVALAGVVGALALALGSVMHEPDQAYFLEGGIRLAKGEASPFAADFYNYDKQFASYWLLGLIDRIFPWMDPVLLGNIASFAVFWSGLVALVWTSRIRDSLQAVAIMACVLSPVFLVHSPFFASAFLAAGFLFFARVVWCRAGGRRAAQAASLLLLGVAIGCRADIVLLLPLWAWLSVPASGIRRMLLRPAPYLLAAVGVAILAVGRLMSRGAIMDINKPFFFPEIFAAFFVFGLGAAALVLALSLASLCMIVWKRRRRPTAFFYACGLVALVPPFAYYAVQMLSPRYWVLTICGQLLFVLSRRGGIAIRLTAGRTRAVAVAILLVAVAGPIFLGLRLPFPAKGHLTVRNPTFFPTADGMMPMGALGWQVWEQHTTKRGIDHNHATWLAAQSVDYRPDSTGYVPVLASGLMTYLQLAIELQGKSAHAVSPDHAFFYTDLRQIMRSANIFSFIPAFNRQQFLQGHDLQVVSNEINGWCIVMGRPGPSKSAGILRTAALAELFQGAEFEPPIAWSESPLRNADFEGRSIVLFSEAPFSTLLKRADGAVERFDGKSVPGLGYAVKLTGRQRESVETTVEATQPVLITAGRLPDYMSSNGR